MSEPHDAQKALEVLEGGLLTTVQDLGRPGHVHEGVPRAGAADSVSLAVANALVGNAAAAPALEITVGGVRIRALRAVTIGLGGADLGAVAALPASLGAVAASPAAHWPPRHLQPGRSHALRTGEEVVFEGRPNDGLGCRAYLALGGGVAVDEILGSRSTSLVGAFGGFEGRALRAGDVLSAATSAPERPPATLPAGLPLPSPAQRVRILAVGRDPAAAEWLARQPWTVSGDSDRRGLRLVAAGAAGAVAPNHGTTGTSSADRPSEAVVPGTIQVTPTGQPLVLMPDAGTTGGYEVAAVVIAADLPLLGQLAPWDEVRFRLVDLATATEAARERRRLLGDIAAVGSVPGTPRGGR